MTNYATLYALKWLREYLFRVGFRNVFLPTVSLAGPRLHPRLGTKRPYRICSRALEGYLGTLERWARLNLSNASA